MFRWESDEALVLLANRDEQGLTKLSIGERLPLDGDSVAAIVLNTGAAGRMDCYDGATGLTAERMRRLGLRSAVGAPIILDRRLWGPLLIGSSQPQPLPPE